jgi:D-alanyl-D-alanine dipeptidase
MPMSRDLAAFRQKPIPPSADVLKRKEGYRREVKIDFSGALANERCVEVRGIGIAGANHYNLANNPPYYVSVPGSIPELYLRRSVAANLRSINAKLADLGVELWLYDGWRPQAVQRYFHDVWFPDWLRRRRPDLSGKAFEEEVDKYWAAPSAGEASPSPHSTGGAVDLTLIFTDEAWTDAYERREIRSMSDEEARGNRRLLYWVMSEAGFANNPTEWWHYSWGDQLWARLSGENAAVYGACDPAGIPA